MTGKLEPEISKRTYILTEVVGLVDYWVKVRGSVEKVYHVNMLKLWHYRGWDGQKEDISANLEENTDDDDVLSYPGYLGKVSVDDVRLVYDLSSEQRHQLKALLVEYSYVFINVAKKLISSPTL